MYTFVVLLVLRLFLDVSPVACSPSSGTIKDHYIVVLRSEFTQHERAKHYELVDRIVSTSHRPEQIDVYKDILEKFEMLKMYALHSSPEMADMIGKLPGVQSISLEEYGVLNQDRIPSILPNRKGRTLVEAVPFSSGITDEILRMSLVAWNLVVQTGASWALSRISHKQYVDYSSWVDEYIYDPHNTSMPMVYVFDGGVFADHKEFDGRVSYGPSFTDDAELGPDHVDGHGTMVMSLALGKTVGVARAARGVSLRIVNAKFRLHRTYLARAVEWVLQQPGPDSLKVLNFSLSLDKRRDSTLLEYILERAVDSGTHVVVSAGNRYEDANTNMPANFTGVITVGAINGWDCRAWFSNYGSVLDYAAPGKSVYAATTDAPWPFTEDHGYWWYDGTSAAAPLVSGVIAYFLSLYGSMTPSDMRRLLDSHATIEPCGYMDSPQIRIINNGNGQ